MIFRHVLAKGISQELKTQTRRLCEDDDDTLKFYDKETKKRGIWSVFRNNRLKWEIGRTYSVQAGRGKTGSCLLVCPECRHIFSKIFFDAHEIYKEHCIHCFVKSGKSVDLKKLKFKIKRLRKQRLLDISNYDASREGIPKIKGKTWRESFLIYFYDVHRKKIKKGFIWNPWVWAITFKVVIDG